MGRFALLILIPCLSAMGQTTWGGLKFGTSLADASTQFGEKAHAEAPNTTGNPNIAVLVIDEIAVDDQKGNARLLFKDATGLYMVVLDFSDFSKQKTGCFGDSSPANDVRKITRLEAISDKLIDRYGKPSSESGRVWPSSQRLISYFSNRELGGIASRRIWKADAQAIEASVSFTCGSMFLTVSYRRVDGQL